jgi:hypothetical protein
VVEVEVRVCMKLVRTGTPARFLEVCPAIWSLMIKPVNHLSKQISSFTSCLLVWILDTGYLIFSLSTSFLDIW